MGQYSHIEGSICEQFGYLQKLGVYPKSSDMKELGGMQRKERTIYV